MTRLELLEKVNEKNIEAVRHNRPERFHTVTVMYNTVIFRSIACDAALCIIDEVISGVPE